MRCTYTPVMRSTLTAAKLGLAHTDGTGLPPVHVLPLLQLRYHP